MLGAGIGSGIFDNCDEFKINISDNSEILAVSDRGAGIGSGYKHKKPIEINIDNAKKIEAKSRRGAAIGNGENSQQNANIRITNTEEVSVNSNERGAGIGTGMYHNREIDENTNGKIYIDNIGKLNVNTILGAGIGTGSTSKENMDIEIKNTNLDINSYHGSGIGTGDDAMKQVDTNPYINIKLDNVKGKVESINGAAIGTGYASKSEKPFDLSIKNSDLEVESYWGAGIGGGRMYFKDIEDDKYEILDTNSGNILIDGGKINAKSGMGSGIGGGGCEKSQGYDDEYKSIFNEGNLKIKGDADILASSIGVEVFEDGSQLVLRDAITAKLEDSERFMGSHTFTKDTLDKYPYNIKVRCEKGLVIKDFTLEETYEDSKKYPKSYSYSTNNQCTSYTEELYYQCGEKEFFGQIIQTEPFREKGRHPENIEKFNSDVNYCGNCPIVICDNTFVTFNPEEITGKYSVTFDANGGEFEDNTLIKIYKVQKNNKIGKPETPIKKDKVFDKWTLDREGKEEFNFEDIIKEDITLYANWKEKGEEIVFTFDANGGKFEDNQSTKEIKIKAGENIKPIASPNREGYKFEFWAKTADCNEEFDFKNKITENTTVYGNWSKKPSLPDGGDDKDTPDKPEQPDKKPTKNIVDTVILANGDKYTDVLTATVLGNELKAPILLTGIRCVFPEVTKEIKRLNPKKIIIVGGEDSVSDGVYKKMENLEFEVERLSGADRYETAREIANRVRNLSGIKDKVTLVDGTNFPDVITISTYASIKHAPILLTEPKSLNNITKKALSDFNISNITIGGETASVSENIEKFLKANYKVERIGGHDRYETASLIAKEVRKLTGNKSDLILVDGTNFPDGITINSLAGKYNSPIHLTNPKTLEEITKKDILDFNIKNILIGGGVASVSANTENYLKDKNIKVERISGSDRYQTAVKISEKFTEK